RGRTCGRESLWGVAGFRTWKRARQHTRPAAAVAVAPSRLARPAGHARHCGRARARPVVSKPRRPGSLMHPVSILLLGLAMSTDAFAAAIGKGAAMRNPRWRDALRAGLVFGLIEATTPI